MARFSQTRRVQLESRLPGLIVQQRLQQRLVAEILGVSRAWVERACKRLGLKTQRTGPRGGAGHPNWNGGWMVDTDGYVTIWMPWHPQARKSGRVLEHRLVMADQLGRPLTEAEVVHHKDGNRQNNHPDNLSLFPNNGRHLAHELKGRVPRWTPKGMAAMRRAGGKRRRRKASDGPQNSRTTTHPTDGGGTQTLDQAESGQGPWPW